MQRRRILLIAGVTASALALTGCVSSETAGEVDDTLTIALTGDPGTLNPITNATQTGMQLTVLGYESLVYFEAGHEPQGLIAESWTESTTEVSFTLKEGISCTDGSELTASDVKSTYEYAADPETGSPFNGVHVPADVVIEADDASRVVTFTTENPQSFLMRTLAYLPIVCASGLEDPSVLDSEIHGTGMYDLADSATGQSYTYELRSDYATGPNGITAETEGLPAVVEAEVVSSEATAVNMLLSGELDVAEIGGTERDRLDNAGLTELEVPDRPGQIFFNQNEARPTDDFDVRYAIASALDREGITSVATAGRGTVKNNLANSLSSVCVVDSGAEILPEHDLDAAMEALDNAGWVEGGDGVREKDGQKLSLKMVFSSSEGAGVTSSIELMQQQLAEVGIEAVPAPATAYTDVIFQGGDWDIVWAPISVALPSYWAGILSGEFPPNGGNWTYNTNQEFFDLTAEASTLAGEESCDAWVGAEEALFENLEVLPISESTSTIYADGFELGVNTNGTVVPHAIRAAA